MWWHWLLWASWAVERCLRSTIMDRIYLSYGFVYLALARNRGLKRFNSVDLDIQIVEIGSGQCRWRDRCNQEVILVSAGSTPVSHTTDQVITYVCFCVHNLWQKKVSLIQINDCDFNLKNLFIHFKTSWPSISQYHHQHLFLLRTASVHPFYSQDMELFVTSCSFCLFALRSWTTH